MHFSASKCYVMNISRSRTVSSHTYRLGNQKLEVVTSHPYLGVQFQNNMEWDTQIAKVSSKASRMMGLMRRNLYNCSEKIKETAYSSLVRPQVESALVVRDPHTKTHVNRIEKVQRNAARFVKNNNDRSPGTVTNLLAELDWNSLQHRRQTARLTLLYKIHKDLLDIPSDRYLTPATRQGLRYSNSSNYQVPFGRLNIYKNSFFPQTIKEWNLLPDQAIQAPSTETFKAYCTAHYI